MYDKTNVKDLVCRVVSIHSVLEDVMASDGGRNGSFTDKLIRLCMEQGSGDKTIKFKEIEPKINKMNKGKRVNKYVYK